MANDTTLAGTPATKPPRGNATEAQGLVKRAVLAVREDKEKAFQSFNDSKGNFVDRDLYILAQDFNGVILAHGANARLIGKNILDVRDLEGRAMIKERIAAAKEHATGWWGEYKWPNPVTKAIERKRTYCEVASTSIIICAGIYVR